MTWDRNADGDVNISYSWSSWGMLSLSHVQVCGNESPGEMEQDLLWVQLLPPDREVAHCTVADSAISIPDFKMVWVDIEAKKKVARRKEADLCSLWKKWCHSSTITLLLLLLLLGCVAASNGCETSCAMTVTITVYIPPHTDPSPSWEVIHEVVTKIQCQHSDALIVISGDFNHEDISSYLGGFT